MREATEFNTANPAEIGSHGMLYAGVGVALTLTKFYVGQHFFTTTATATASYCYFCY